MRLDGVHRHEQLARDLLVRAACGDEPGDAPLRLGETLFTPAAADARELTLRLRTPELGAKLVEDRKRSLDRLTCRALLPKAAERLTLREQRACEVEASVLHARMLGERPLEGRDRAGLVAAYGGKEPAAARGARERPRAIEPHGPLLDPGKELLRLSKLTARDRSLGLDREQPEERRFLDPSRARGRVLR